MAGENLRRLQAAVDNAREESLEDSELAWRKGHRGLEKLSETLTDTADKAFEGFSDGLAADEQGTAHRAKQVFLQLRADVVEPRRKQMGDAAEALKEARKKLHLARNASKGSTNLPDKPESPDWTVVNPNDPAIRLKYAKDLSKYNDKVDDLNARDETARKALQDLNDSYGNASAVFAKIHGEPVYPEDLPPPGEEPGPGGRHGSPGASRVSISGPSTATPGTPSQPQVEVPHPYLPGPGDIPDSGGYGTPHPVGGTLGRPDAAPGGISPLAGGTVAAGLLGGPGLFRGIRGALSSRAVFGPKAAAIGSTNRPMGQQTLGRSGSVSPGSQVNRAGGGRGAGGRGVGGSQGGRGRGGSAGRRGAAAGSGRGRGRGKNDPEGRDDLDLWDDGSDWIDDEGMGPAVLR